MAKTRVFAIYVPRHIIEDMSKEGANPKEVENASWKEIQPDDTILEIPGRGHLVLLRGPGLHPPLGGLIRHNGTKWTKKVEPPIELTNAEVESALSSGRVTKGGAFVQSLHEKGANTLLEHKARRGN